MSNSPVIFQFKYEDAWGKNFLSVEWLPDKDRLSVLEEDSLIARMKGVKNCTEYEIPDRRWAAFWRKLDAMKAWGWPNEFQRPQRGFGADGDHWKMTVGYGRRLIKTCGHNAYRMSKRDKLAARYAEARWTSSKGDVATCTYGHVELLKAIVALYAPSKPKTAPKA